MSRIVILGGRGFFGRAAAELLRGFGHAPLSAARRAGADLALDAEDGAGLRRTLREGDVVLDAAGPFQARTTALVEAALDVGFHVVDVGDALGYAERVVALRGRLDAAGVAVCPSASTVSAVTVALVRLSGIAAPVRVSGFLVPAARHTAVEASSVSLMGSVGRPVRVWEDGRMTERAGWTTRRRAAGMPAFGSLDGHLFESADALFLPMAFPSLRSVGSHVDTRVPGLNAVLSAAARVPPLLAVVKRMRKAALPLTRRFGRADGGYAVEVEDGAGRVARLALASSGPGYFTAVAPAALAARALAEGTFAPRGLVPPHDVASPEKIVALLEGRGIELLRG
jgi:hypothetical protein